jgi:hypothetical protein
LNAILPYFVVPCAYEECVIFILFLNEISCLKIGEKFGDSFGSNILRNAKASESARFK